MLKIKPFFGIKKNYFKIKLVILSPSQMAHLQNYNFSVKFIVDIVVACLLLLLAYFDRNTDERICGATLVISTSIPLLQVFIRTYFDQISDNFGQVKFII